jgi:N-methylhydantoinase A/oxoprolinase/acetone carboxylase beta subunit
MYGLYSGQTFANRVPLRGWPVTDEAVAGWKQDVHEYYEKVYGYSALESPIVVTTLTVVGSGPAGHLPMVEVQAGGERPPDDAVVARELASLDGSQAREVPFFDRQKLLARNRIEGSAIIDDGLATIVVPPASVAVVDAYGNIQIRVG